MVVKGTITWLLNSVDMGHHYSPIYFKPIIDIINWAGLYQNNNNIIIIIND
jgi:hypothetical protein